ncbi:hypothetical protein DPMN_001557 [Dreissena polymorpha]|uniref:HTH psq-type domain-containing protein n=1 Tax=Dreissena polymorpha TaxID=45954 RepID=A0A9D4RQG0_DREPO|nr:hypothetical protein DPMN_001557 [Dreissena polymorpha]
MENLKQYTHDKLIAAYKTVKENHIKVDRAALTFGVPKQTFRDRVLNKENVNARLGKDSLFAFDEEEPLVNHIESLAQVGYGLNRAQLNVLASELTVKFVRRNSDDKLSNYWYYNFLKRWDHRQ